MSKTIIHNLLKPPSPRAKILYRNHRGDIGWRRILPKQILFTHVKPWYTTDEWLLHAFDFDKKEHRFFALSEIRMWKDTPVW
jgi:hypothetical protein